MLPLVQELLSCVAYRLMSGKSTFRYVVHFSCCLSNSELWCSTISLTYVPHQSILPLSGTYPPQISYWARVSSWSMQKHIQSPSPCWNLRFFCVFSHRVHMASVSFVPNEKKPLGASSPYKLSSAIPAFSQSTGDPWKERKHTA